MTIGGSNAGRDGNGVAVNEGNPVRKSSHRKKIRVVNEDHYNEDEPSVSPKKNPNRKSRGRTRGPRKKRKTGNVGMTELEQTLRNSDEAQIMDLIS